MNEKELTQEEKNKIAQEIKNNEIFEELKDKAIYEKGYVRNTIGTISSTGNFYEEEIPHISKDFMLKSIKSALKEAFSAPEFVGNDDQCPSDDDGTWWNNHRLVPSTTVVEVNHHIWYVSFQD